MKTAEKLRQVTKENSHKKEVRTHLAAIIGEAFARARDGESTHTYRLTLPQDADQRIEEALRTQLVEGEGLTVEDDENCQADGLRHRVLNISW